MTKVPKRPHGDSAIRVGLVAQNNFKGGAGIAVSSLHSHIRRVGAESGLESHLRVIESGPEASSFQAGLPPRGATRRFIKSSRISARRAIEKYVLAQPGQLRSRATIRTGLGKEINGWDVDVINLHWLGDATLSLREIAQVKHPVVFTLHDLWPGLGTLHYPEHSGGAQMNSGDVRWPWLETHFEKKKKALWSDRFFAIAPSKSVADRAKLSGVMKNWPIWVVPNAIDTEFWAPGNQAEARKNLGLGREDFVVVFPVGSSAGEYRKGADLWEGSLSHLVTPRERGRRITCLRISQEETVVTYSWGMERQMTPLSQEQLRTVYQAADIVAVPSRQETFSLVALEAQACGTPVIAFDTMGLSDAIVHDQTGFLVPPFDTKQFAERMMEVAAEPQRLNTMARNARDRAVTDFAPARVIAQTAEVFREVCELFSQRQAENPSEEFA